MVDQKGKVGLGSEVPIDPQKPLRLMMYRDELNSHVLREMRRLQPTVRLQLNTQVTRIDLDRRQVAFTEESRPEEASTALACCCCCSSAQDLHVCRSGEMWRLQPPGHRVSSPYMSSSLASRMTQLSCSPLASRHLSCHVSCDSSTA